MTARPSDKLDAYDVLSLLSLGLAIATTALLLSALPGRFPLRFNFDGEAIGWTTRGFGAWFLPALGLGLWLLLRLGGLLLPAAWRARFAETGMTPAAFVVVLLLVLLQGFCLYAALHPWARVGWALWTALGLHAVVLGQILQRVGRNPWLGIRTRWTLASDENWDRIHRFAGLAFGIAGAAAMVAGTRSGIVALAALVAGIAIPVAYASRLARQQSSEG